MRSGRGRLGAGVRAVLAGAFLAALCALGLRQGVAEEAPPPSETVLAFRVASDLPLGRSFAFGVAPAGAPGTPATASVPLSGTIEVCAREQQGSGRLTVIFDDDTALDFARDGCQSATLTSAGSVALQALRGTWDVILRRLYPGGTAPSAPNTYQATQVTARTPLGRTLALMTAPPSAAGTLPSGIELFTGTVEVCVTLREIVGLLRVYVDDTPTLELLESGCWQMSATSAGSVTLTTPRGLWDVVVRALP